MTIRAKLRLFVILCLFVVIGVIFFTYLTFREAGRASAHLSASSAIARGVYELNILASDYLLHYDKRPKLQWQSRHESIQELLSKMILQDHGEKAILDRIADHLEAVKTYFTQLVSSYERQKANREVELNEQLRRRIVSLLLVASQKAFSEASQWESKSHRRLLLAQRRAVVYILILAGILGLVMTVSFVFIAGSILPPLFKLQEGARIVGSGNLEFLVGLETDDEVGQLSRSFDQMVANLRVTMASRDELKTEITERLRVEGELQKSRDELESRVETRTAELASVNTKLEQEIQERKTIEATREDLIVELGNKNAELERFAYTVSHDLKSPLITIRGFIGLLEADIPKGDMDRIGDAMVRISSAAEKMEKLLDELLELSRIGRLVNPPVEVSLADLTAEAVNLLAGAIAEKSVRVEVSPDLPVVFADKPRMVEVLQNLIENAVKFMGDQQSPHIAIGVRKADDDVLCYVQDNGKGIQSRYQARVFDLFDKLDQDSEGTGVGLAIVKRIIEVHRGRIWVESEGPGKGCTFCFTIPKKGAGIA